MSTDLIEILRKINPTSSTGFEGLIASLLEALTGRHFSLANSGFQEGRDMSSRQISANVVYVECKRYGKDNELDERELHGELDQAIHATPDLDVWVLVATRDVSSKLHEKLHMAAADHGVEFYSLSLGDGSPSSLETLCAFSPETVIAHPAIRAIEKPEKIKGLLQRLAQQPQFAQKVEALKTNLSSSLIGYENWRVVQNQWLVQSLTSDRESRSAFGQLLNLEGKDVKLITRASAWEAL